MVQRRTTLQDVFEGLRLPERPRELGTSRSSEHGQLRAAIVLRLGIIGYWQNPVVVLQTSGRILR